MTFIYILGKWVFQTHVKRATSQRPGLHQLVKPSKHNVPLCRNFGTSNNYYSTLCSNNVTIHREDVQSVTGNSLILGDGTKLDLDVSEIKLCKLFIF